MPGESLELFVWASLVKLKSSRVSQRPCPPKSGEKQEDGSMLAVKAKGHGFESPVSMQNPRMITSAYNPSVGRRGYGSQELPGQPA